MEKKAKKVVKHIAEATVIELLKELIRRVFRRKTAVDEAIEVPCNVADRVRFFIDELTLLSKRTYQNNILRTIENVAGPISSSEISRYLKELQEKHKWVEKEVSDAKDSFKNFEKYNEAEWLKKTSKHLVNAMEEYGKFSKPLDEILLMHSKPNTLKSALRIIQTYYVSSKDFFNRLVFDYHKFSEQYKDYAYHLAQHDAIQIFLKDVPSKENLLTLAKVTAKETVSQ